MKKIKLKRISAPQGTGACTLGVLIDEKEIPICVSLELPWRDNIRNISCIPSGSYVCTRYLSKKFGECFIVNDVKNRAGILFHAGNTSDDIEGCIALGIYFSSLTGRPSIVESKKAVTKFMAMLQDFDRFDLEVLDP